MKAKTKAAGKGESKVVLKLVDVVAIGNAAAHLAHDIEALGTLQSMGFIGLSASGREISAKVPDSKEEFFFLEYEICPSNQKPCKLVRMRRGVCQEIDAGRTMYIEAAPNVKGILQVTVRGDRLSQWTLNCTVPAAVVHEEYIHTVRTKGIMSQRDVLPGSSARVALPPMPTPPATVAKPKAAAPVARPTPPAPAPPAPRPAVAVAPVPKPAPAPAPAPRAVTPAPVALAVTATPAVLLPSYPHAQPVSPAWVVLRIPVNRIRVNPEQPRKTFNKTELNQLADSLRTGQNEPIEVIKIEGDPRADYELVKGERRWRAAQMISLGTLDAILRTRELVPDKNAQHRRCFVGDFHHARYGKIETILALLREEKAGASQKELSAMCGKNLVWVSNHLAMRNLHPDLLKLLDPSLPRKEQISFSVARELARAPLEKQMGMYERLMKIEGQRLQLLEAESLVSQYIVRRIRKRKPSSDSRNLYNKIPTLRAEATKAIAYDGEVFASFVQSYGQDNAARVIEHLLATADNLRNVAEKIKTAQAAQLAEAS